jgi:hypothetical protein
VIERDRIAMPPTSSTRDDVSVCIGSDDMPTLVVNRLDVPAIRSQVSGANGLFLQSNSATKPLYLLE